MLTKIIKLLNKPKGFVYQWTNINNGKWYIGSHEGKPNDGYICSSKVFKNAIKKYGIKNFKRRILYKGTNFHKKEEKILKKLDAANNNKSYNLKNECFGISLPKEKNGMWKIPHTKESKNKMSKTLKKLWTSEKKKHHSEKVIGKNNGMYNKKHSQYSINKIKNTRIANKKEWNFLNHGNIHRKIFREIYKKLILKGKYSAPRGLKIIELQNFHCTFPPYVRFINFKNRKLSLNYIKKELLWYIKGDKFDTSITKEATMWSHLINKDGSINSNYGQYIFGKQNQFDRVVNILKKDKESRRAIIVLLNNGHLKSHTLDYPCTCTINFHIRDSKLYMYVHMRSQDGVYGLGNDLPCFSMMHEMLYVTLKQHYKNLEYGDYYHSVDSFHVYEKHFEMIEELTNIDISTKRCKNKYTKSKFSLVLCPKISNINEVKFLRKLDFSKIPNNFNFTKWLNTYE